MSGTVRSLSVGYDELAALKLLALDGALYGEVKASCSDLAARLDASNQTASRRLQGLDDAGLIERDIVGDGQWITITDEGERALQREYEDYRRIFEEPSDVGLSGTVTSGMGEGRHYISLPGYMAQFEDRLGYTPYEGTLNVSLDREGVHARPAMEAIEPIPIDGWEDDDRTYGPAVCYPVSVETGDGESYEPVHAIAPERSHHDDDQLELIAPVMLREELGLADGDDLTVHVEVE